MGKKIICNNCFSRAGNSCSPSFSRKDGDGRVISFSTGRGIGGRGIYPRTFPAPLTSPSKNQHEARFKDKKTQDWVQEHYSENPKFC